MSGQKNEENSMDDGIHISLDWLSTMASTWQTMPAWGQIAIAALIIVILGIAFNLGKK
jgi:hypothetical protein